MGEEKDNVLLTKSFEFSVNVYHFTKVLKDNMEFEIANQLFCSGTSIGANAEEAVGGFSRKDFAAKMGIAYKEARETIYWLRLLIEVGVFEEQANALLLKADELARILASILKSTRENNS